MNYSICNSKSIETLCIRITDSINSNIFHPTARSVQLVLSQQVPSLSWFPTCSEAVYRFQFSGLAGHPQMQFERLIRRPKC